MKPLTLIVALLILVSFPLAQSDPATLPRLEPANLQYAGAFRVPATTLTGADLSYGGQPITFNPSNNSLFVGTLHQQIAEISIETPDATASQVARYLQPAIADPTEGRLRELTPDTGSIALYGLLVDDKRLVVSASPYYDGGNVQRVSHSARSTNLTEPSFSGWSRVWQEKKQGFVAGWMAWVPQEWRALLGGPAITGNGGLAIITRTSFGPSAFAFDPANIGQPTVAATPLLYYPGEHATLGTWGGSNGAKGPNVYFNQTAQIGGVVLVAGTRTALFFGRIGVGPECYGHGVKDQALHGKPAADNVTSCYDPLHAAKGSHAYPYRYQIWAYDLNEWAAVKRGKVQPWAVRPYAVWPIEQLAGDIGTGIGGVGYDLARQTIYFSQLQANKVGCCGVLPVIHAIKVSTAAPAPKPVR